MDDDADANSDAVRMPDLSLRSEEIGYPPGEMLACDRCGKRNAPNRAACLYCGAPVKGAVAETKLDLRKLENWERGYNVVITNAGTADLVSDINVLSSLIEIGLEDLSRLLASPRAVPIARLASEHEAEALKRELAKFGLLARIVGDETLIPNTPPIRLRTITLHVHEVCLKEFNTGESVYLRPEELAVLVTGSLAEDRTELIEKRKRGATQTLSETWTSHDAPVLDIYSTRDAIGWRVTAHGFDFSCLGDKKSMLVAENMRVLVATLRQFAPGSILVDHYEDQRRSLELCWPSESRRDSHGFRRSGFARKDLSRVASTNNLIQFTKFSRLQWHLR